MNKLCSETQIRNRIQELEKAFGPSGVQLSKPGRVLVGEGVLKKQGRKKWEPKVFLLFNDILVYGSIITINRWYTNQKVLPLKEIELEDLEDLEDSKNQWQISTPRKSFYVSAKSHEEKEAWMSNIKDTQSSLLQNEGLRRKCTLAKSWIPDHVTQKCMRCFVTFTMTNRRHHCRKCGFVVCNECSKGRAIIENIDPNKLLRICKLCNKTGKDEKNSCDRRGSCGSWGDSGEKSRDYELPISHNNHSVGLN